MTSLGISLLLSFIVIGTIVYIYYLNYRYDTEIEDLEDRVLELEGTVENIQSRLVKLELAFVKRAMRGSKKRKEKSKPPSFWPDTKGLILLEEPERNGLPKDFVMAVPTTKNKGNKNVKRKRR